MNRFISNGVRIMVRFNLSRAFNSIYGLIYLLIGIVMPLLISVLLLSSFRSLVEYPVGASILGQTIPAIIPLTATIGGMGVTYLFSTDRSNGVYEYLIATGKIKIRDIFLSFSIVTMALISIILGIDITTIIVLVHFIAPTVAGTMLELIGVFSVPVAYVSSLISILAMLTWVSMSKTYPGVNAPGGIGSIIGIIPPLAFLLVIVRIVHPSDIILIAGLFSAALLMVFIVLLIVVVRKMSNERMLT